MKTTYSITELQRALPKVVRQAARGSAVAISRHNETVAFLISRERFEMLAETLEVMANPNAMAALENAAAGKGEWFGLDALDDEAED
jgi:prevent-host-death family protein